MVREEVKGVLVELQSEKSPEVTVHNGDFVNADEAIKILDLSKSTLYKMVHLNKIPFLKQGRKKLLFNRNDLHEWLVRNRNLDMNGTAPDGWNEKAQQHFIYQQPPAWWTAENWK